MPTPASILVAGIRLWGIVFTLGPAASIADTTPKFDIVYSWNENREAALEEKKRISKILGPNVAAKLEMIQTAEGYGVIYDRNGDLLSTEAVAVRHAELLGDFPSETIRPIADRETAGRYNISYFLTTSLPKAQSVFEQIYDVLGPDVGKRLVVERSASGNYVVVYQMEGDLESVRALASRHAEVLKPRGLDASFREEQSAAIVLDEARFLNPGAFEPLAPLPPKKPELSVPEIKAEPPPSQLEREIDSYIKRLRGAGRIPSNERTAWYVHDLTDGETLVSINEDVPLQAASMIKPMVALAFFHNVKEGKFIYGPKSKANMEAMIQVSDNPATNWVMRQVGGPQATEQLLRTHYGDIIKDIRLVEYIPKGGGTYGNKASALDYGRFLHALWKGNLPMSDELRRLMFLPGRDRLYDDAKRVPEGTLVYNKTGSTAMCCGDMGILNARGRDGKRYPYIIIGIIESSRRTSSYGTWISARGDVIREVSNMVYLAMKERHNLE